MADAAWAGTFQDFAAELIARSGITAAAVALARDGEVVLSRGFGHRDAAGARPVTSDTRFGLGSVTKAFPALAVMQLEDDGTLSVHDPVTRWLPRFQLPADPANTARVSVHHLLTHASGIPPEPALLHARAASICADPDLTRMHPRPLGIPDGVEQLEQIESYDELMALMARQRWRVLAEPGRVLSYSNEGYVLLAAIIERASGEQFPDYLRRRVLEPLGMSRSGLYDRHTPPLEPEVVPAAVDTRGGTREVFASPAWWDQGKMFGNGGLKSTAADLLRYLEIYRTGGESHGRRVVSPAGIAKMTAPQAEIATGGWYGYGLRVDDVPGMGRIVEHGGGNKGVATHVLVVPERGLTAVALTNLANAPAAKLAYGVVNAYLGARPDAPWRSYPEYAPARGSLRRYVGRYAGQPGVVVEVVERAGALHIEVAGTSNRARPYAAGSFLIEATEEPVRFLDDDRGVWAMAMGLRTLPRLG